MANIKDFIKKIGNESVSLEEQQKALAQVEKTIIEAKAKREESIGKNVDLVISALKTIESKLETKLVELNNTPAKQGVQGIQGPTGRDGRDGIDGYKGKDGKDGVDGKDGKDGEDGISVSDAQIDFDGSLLITLSDGREIDAGTVIPLDVAKQIHSVSTNGGGTSQSVLDAITDLQTQINTLTGIDGTLGTMAQQDANAVAITGGTINGTSIGATTPAAGTFTTITGQTEVLRGTGQNLVVQSQAFATTWAGSGLTRTNNASTAPDSTNTASSLIETATTAVHWAFTSVGLNLFAGTYTLSCYIKASGRTAATLAISGNTSNQYSAVTFDLNGVAVTQTNVAGTGFSVTSSSITSVGSGWYRCVMTTAIPARSDYLFMLSTSDATTFSPNSIGGANSYAGNATLGILAWGAQLEAYSTVGTYIPTTTTSILGSPTLSFGNLAYIGMENNGAVYVQPALTGALQAQATTSSTVGGNARGANAVDWQMNRNSAGQVASNSYSSIGGGQTNTSSGYASTIAGGRTNTANIDYSVVSGGFTNTASGQYSAIMGGYSNTAAGIYNFIGGGYTNSGTANGAVTTQSATMNGTTAVTLSGSNANIKVGQIIFGTSISSGTTYVAAISGTSLTLSQNASGSSTSTLSFYTPHGVVVGGGNNQATGSYSFIGGGGDAGTAANRNVASGDYSVVCGGRSGTASGTGAFVGGGGFFGLQNTYPNTASGTASAVVGGLRNTASGEGAFVGSGDNNIANANYSSIAGGNLGTARSIRGNAVFPACQYPMSTTLGVSQAALVVLARQTTDATPTALASDTSAAGTTNQVILPNNSAYLFKATVISNVTGGGNTSGWKLEGVIKRGANAASTTIVGSVTTTLLAQDAGAATWAIAATADTTNGGLRITFTGQAATTIRTVCKVETTEVTF